MRISLFHFHEIGGSPIIWETERTLPTFLRKESSYNIKDTNCIFYVNVLFSKSEGNSR